MSHPMHADSGNAAPDQSRCIGVASPEPHSLIFQPGNPAHEFKCPGIAVSTTPSNL